MRCLAVSVVASLIIGATFSSEADAHNAPKRCGSKPGLGFGWAKVRAHGPVWCRKARKVARRWERKIINGDWGASSYRASGQATRAARRRRRRNFGV